MLPGRQQSSLLLTVFVLGLAACSASGAGNRVIDFAMHPAAPPRTAVQLQLQEYGASQQTAKKNAMLPPIPATAADTEQQQAASPASTQASAASTGQAPVEEETVAAGQPTANTGSSNSELEQEAEPTLLSTSVVPDPEPAAVSVSAAAGTPDNAATTHNVQTTTAHPATSAPEAPRRAVKDVTAMAIAAGLPVPTAASGATIIHYVNPNVAPTKHKPAVAVLTATTAAGTAQTKDALAAPYMVASNPTLTPTFSAKPKKATAGPGTIHQPTQLQVSLVASKLGKPVMSGSSKPAAAQATKPTAAAGPILHASFGSGSSSTSTHKASTTAANVASAPIVAASTPAASVGASSTAPAALGSKSKVADTDAASAAARAFLPAKLELPGPTIKPPAPFVFQQKGATKMLKIGCSVPFEGSQKSVGEAVFQAMKMAVTEVAPKELPGVNVNLTCLNSKCDDIPAYQAVNKFANEKAVAVVGDICSRASVAAAGVGNSRKMVVISPASTSPSLSEIDYFFRTVPSDKFQGVAAANLMRTNKLKNIGLVYEDNAYGYGLAFNVIAAFTKEGGAVPVTYKFTYGKGDAKAASAQMKQGMKDKKLDGVFVSTSNLTFAADFMVAARSAGLTVPIYGGDALADYTLFQDIRGRPSVLKNLTTLSVAPGSKDFVAAYSRFTKTQPSVSYQAYAAHAYDAAVAVMKAYQGAAAPKDGAAIKQQMQKLQFQGVAGPVLFDQHGDLIPDNKTYVYLNFNATNGERIVKGFVSDQITQ